MRDAGFGWTRHSSLRTRAVTAAMMLTLPGIAACFIFRGVQTTEVARTPAPAPVHVTTPVKVHLTNGSTVMFRGGLTIYGGAVSGVGVRYGLSLADSAYVNAVSLDSVAAMESFHGETHWGPTIIVSTLATGVVLGGIAVAAGAGTSQRAQCTSNCSSCPTVYSDSAGSLTLEAELFSLSIAPLFERRDVHVLRAQPDATGTVSLEVRDEMLETHYINQLSLLEVRHDADETVVPDGADAPIAVRAPVAASAMRDRSGRDVRAMLAAGVVYRSDERLLTGASSSDLNDFIDLTVPAPAGGFPSDSVAIVFDLKSSPLTTMLLRDRMLAQQGARGVDWEASDLSTIGYAVELGRWYGRRMGLHVAVAGDTGYTEAAYIPDGGPLVFRRVAAVVPAPRGDTLHARLWFVADHWRIRSITIASRVRHPTPRIIEPTVVLDARDHPDSAALRNLSDADASYVMTTPGQRFTLHFDVGAGNGMPRTFLLGAQGYYTEWILGSWIRGNPSPIPYLPGDSSLVLEMHQWGATRGSTAEERFTSFIPVR